MYSLKVKEKKKHLTPNQVDSKFGGLVAGETVERVAKNLKNKSLKV